MGCPNDGDDRVRGNKAAVLGLQKSLALTFRIIRGNKWRPHPFFHRWSQVVEVEVAELPEAFGLAPAARTLATSTGRLRKEFLARAADALVVAGVVRSGVCAVALVTLVHARKVRR